MRYTPSYLVRGLLKYSGRANERYRFYWYWLGAERRSRSGSRESIRAIQWRKLKEMLDYAYRIIPFHRDRFKEAGLTPEMIRTPTDLSRIPVMTKDDIRQNFPDRLVVQGKKFKEWHLGQTSGSTADSMHFIRPDEAARRGLSYSVFRRAGGITNLPIVMFTTPHCTAGACSLVDEQPLWIHRIQSFPLFRHLDNMIGLPSNQKNVLAASDAYYQNLVDHLSRLAPCILIVDPVYLAALVRYMEKKSIPAPPVRHIITTYELLTGSFKGLFEKAFGCQVYTQYGGSELLDVANECEYHTLHAMPDNVWVEVMRDGRSAKPGEVGRAILTDLGNFNMPFLRYDIGDLLEVGDGPCPCGRHTDAFAACHGRARDAIPLGTGGFLTPLQADALFKDVKGVAFYKLVQAEKDVYRISIMPDGAPETVDRETILTRCRKMFGETGRFDIKCVAEIKPERSLKYRFVYSECGEAEV